MDYWPSVKSRWMDIGQAKKEWGQYSSTLPQQAYLNLWKKETLVEHGGKSQAGKIVPSWPLRKPITVQGLVYLSCSWSHNVQLQKITIPPWKVFHFNPPSTWNFHSRGVCEDPPSPPEFPFFLYPHFRTPRKFQVVLNVENWRLTEVQSILFITLLRYLRFILLLMWKKS